MVDGAPPPGEAERIEKWFNRFMTGARGLMWRVFNGEGVKPVIVGDGLEALKDLSINKELRYEIHQALGTRHLLEDENLATAVARERQFYTVTIVPDARLIQTSLNEQILHPLGYHIEFEPERLEIFQVNEGEQAKAFGELLGIFKEGMSFEAAFQLAAEKLDYQFTDEQLKLIKLGIAEKARAKKMLMEEYGLSSNFFTEIESSIKRNCKRQQDVQAYLYSFQGFANDLITAIGSLMQFKIRIPLLFKKTLYKLIEQTMLDITNHDKDWKKDDVRALVFEIRNLREKLGYSESWMAEYLFPVILIAKGAKKTKL